MEEKALWCHDDDDDDDDEVVSYLYFLYLYLYCAVQVRCLNLPVEHHISHISHIYPSFIISFPFLSLSLLTLRCVHNYV